MGDALRDALFRAGIQQLLQRDPSNVIRDMALAAQFPLVHPSATLDLSEADRVMLKTFRISPA